MIYQSDIDHALRHVREIGGNASVRTVLTHALGHHAHHVKHELRYVGLGCGDDMIASRIEDALVAAGHNAIH